MNRKMHLKNHAMNGRAVVVSVCVCTQREEPHTKRLSFNAFVSGHVRAFGFGRKKMPKHFCFVYSKSNPNLWAFFFLPLLSVLFHLNIQTHEHIVHYVVAVHCSRSCALLKKIHTHKHKHIYEKIKINWRHFVKM